MRSTGALVVLLLTAQAAWTQPDGAEDRDPAHRHWQWFFDLRLPDKMDGPYVALVLPPAVFGKSQPKADAGGESLRDLRLADAMGVPVPFALRIMRGQFQRTEVAIIRQFNAAPIPKERYFEASYELAAVPAPGHNEIDIATAPMINFRRKVEVFGDDNDQFTHPKSLLGPGKYLVHYDVEGKIVDVHRFRYDFMQFRFLKVRVYADDPAIDKEIPTITGIKVRRLIEVPGEFATEQATLAFTDFVRGYEGPASASMIQLPDRMPCEKLTLELNGGEPSERPMHLEIADENQPRQPVGNLDVRWRKDEKDANRHLLELNFGEVVAQRLRLVITDFANEPMRLSPNVKVTTCVRKLIFEKPDPAKVTLPLRLYVGNPDATPANYVLAQKLPAILQPPPPLASLDNAMPNPSYEPPPKQLHERAPWLVHVVLGCAGAVLLLILAALARQAIVRHDRAHSGTVPT